MRPGRHYVWAPVDDQPHRYIVHRFWIRVRHDRREVVKEQVDERGFGCGQQFWPLDCNAGMARLAEEDVPLDVLEL